MASYIPDRIDLATWVMPEEMAADLREIGESPEQVTREIRAGKEPCVSTTPNNRDIRVSPAGFIVQPRNDNYWLAVPTIDAAMDAYEHPERWWDEH